MEMARQANAQFDGMRTSYDYIDKDGHSWCVQIDVTYVYQYSLDAMAAAMGQPSNECFGTGI